MKIPIPFIQSLIAIIIFAASVSPSPAQYVDFGQYHALLIANEKYDHWNELKTPVNDVKAIAKILKKKYRFTNIDILENVTRSEIVDRIEKYNNELAERDNLLIYYAGHGIKREDGAFWIGVEAKKKSSSDWLNFVTLINLIDKNHRLKARHVLIIADSCHAGHIFRQDDVHPIELSSKEDKYSLAVKLHANPSRSAITSGGDEPVLDRYGNSEHSVFATEMIDKLNQNKDVLAASTLWKKLEQDVPARSKRAVNQSHVPKFGMIAGAGGSDGGFHFVPAGVQVPYPEETIITDVAEFGIRGKDSIRSKSSSSWGPEFDWSFDMDWDEGFEKDSDPLFSDFDIEASDNAYRPFTESFATYSIRKNKEHQDFVDNFMKRSDENDKKWQDSIENLLKRSPKHIHGPHRTVDPPLDQTHISPRERQHGSDAKTNEDNWIVQWDFDDVPSNLSVFDGSQDDNWAATAIQNERIKTNECKMEFVFIKPGTFTMGSSIFEPDRNPDELQHQVTITRGFYIQTREVTFGQWRAIMGANHRRNQWGIMDESAVDEVSWTEIQAFLSRLNKYDNNTYRLPTEAEWEYAARSGTKGLHDMRRGVSEWCQDYYGDYPDDGRVMDPQGPDFSFERVIRGARTNSKQSDRRLAKRNSAGPDSKETDVGFRLILTPGS